MIGLGTLINVAGILGGGLIGIIFKRYIKTRFQETLMVANGVCVLFIGISGALSQIFSVQNSALTSRSSIMMIVCFLLGSLCGELLNIEKRAASFGNWLKKKTKSDKDARFVDGFVTASMTVCIGAMAIVGAMQDGISGDYSLLVAKTVLDAIIIMVMAASMGKGCLFSAIPVALLQGSVTLLAKWISPLMTTQALANLSLTGSILIFCVGINLVWDKKIRVANMLPTVLFAVLWAFLPLPY